MFEVLVYLFENYFEADVFPDQGTLARELSAAGFEDDDIEQAFDWYRALESKAQESAAPSALPATGMRLYAEPELTKLSSDSRGFLLFLEQAGVMRASQRELVIDRAMALPDPVVSLETLKWIVLMSLWQQDQAQDYLFIADAIFGDEQPTLH